MFNSLLFTKDMFLTFSICLSLVSILKIPIVKRIPDPALQNVVQIVLSGVIGVLALYLLQLADVGLHTRKEWLYTGLLGWGVGMGACGHWDFLKNAAKYVGIVVAFLPRNQQKPSVPPEVKLP